MAPKDGEHDRDIFFPERGESHNEGKRICAGCPVKNECAHYAYDTDTGYGMWAGYMRTREDR